MISFKSFLFLLHFRYLASTRITPKNFLDPAIGRWKLLYTDSILYNKKNDCYLDIFPFSNGNDQNKLSVEINRIEKKNILILRKKITSKTVCFTPSTLLDTIQPLSSQTTIKLCNLQKINNKTKNKCSLVILTSEKFIQSIGIFQIPYF